MFRSRQMIQVVLLDEVSEEGIEKSQATILLSLSPQLKSFKALKEIIQKTGFSLETKSLYYKRSSNKVEIKTDQDVETMILNFKSLGTQVCHKITCRNCFIPPLSKEEFSEILIEKLSQKYKRKVQNLGRGAFGFVYEILPSSENEKSIAVKVVQDYLGNVNNLFDEVKNTLIVEHPHIVRTGSFFILENVKNRKVLCLEMEKMQGSLKSLFIEKQQKPSERIAVMIINQVCQAFQKCVEKNLCHRDIKPDNILVKSLTSDSIHIALTDFGCAFLTSSLNGELCLNQKKHHAFGTSRYLAPEVSQDFSNFSILSDIFSLGITMNFLMLSRLGEKGEVLCDKLEQVESDLSECQASPFVSQLILGMIQKDPKQRMTLDVLLKMTSEFLSSTKISFKLEEEKHIYRINIPYYPKYEELRSLIKEKIKHDNFSITFQKNFTRIVSNNSENYEMITHLLSKEPKDRIITLQLCSIETLLQQALNSYENGNFKLTLDFCKQILRQKPSSVKVRVLCAYCYYYLREYKKAIEYFEPIHEQEFEQDVKFYDRFAYCYFKIGNYEKASELYEKALSNNHYKTYHVAGVCAAHLKLFEKSIRFFAKSYSLNRKNIEAITVIVSILEKISESVLNIHSMIDLSDFAALFALGLYFKNRNKEESDNLLEKALEICPNDENIKNALK